MSSLFIRVSHGGREDSVSADRRVFVGRKGCDVEIEDDYLSAPHVVFWPDEAGWLLEDTASTNGTWIGMERIYGPRRVSKGEKVRIGRTILTLVPM